VRNLNLRAKLIVEGMIAGIHRSPYHGFSAEFLEYRPYFTGESIRFIDWRKYARTGRTVVRLFEDETNLYANLLIDRSASMAFRSTPAMTKYEYAQTLCASLAWVLIRQRDAVGFAAFGERVGSRIPPRSTNLQLKTIIGEIDRLEPLGGTHCGASIEWLAASLRKRGLTVVISDFFDDAGQIVNGLRHLRFKRQDVIALWLHDPMESDFSHTAPLRLIDMETGRRLNLDPRVAAEQYAEGLERHRSRIERACRELAVDLEHIGTDEPFQKALVRVLQKRMRLQ